MGFPPAPVMAAVHSGSARPNFSLDAFMASQADGVFYDFTKTDRHFQESTGATIADDVTEAIGLALDQRLWGGRTLAQIVAAATELVSNGSFAGDLTGWTNARPLRGDVDYLSGTVLITNDSTNGQAGGFAAAVQGITTVVGGVYRLSADMVAGAWILRASSASDGSVSIAEATGSGTVAGQTIYFVATGTTTYVTLMVNSSTNGISATIDNVSCKLIPGHAALQATGTSRGTRQTGGWKGDGSDDNLLTNYLAGSGANFLVTLVTVPASLGTDQIIAGTRAAGSDDFWIGVRSSDGKIIGGVGAHSSSTVLGSTDQRGNTLVLGLSADSGSEALYVDAAQEYAGTPSGTINTTVPFRLGCRNTNGTPSNFFAGAIQKFAAGRELLTLSKYQQIRSALLAA